jgi:hypothetical protein
MSDYYTKNREALLLKSKVYYQKRKQADPEFYLKPKPIVKTEYKEEEPDLIQMKANIEWIKYTREQDMLKKAKKNNLCYR